LHIYLANLYDLASYKLEESLISAQIRHISKIRLYRACSIITFYEQLFRFTHQTLDVFRDNLRVISLKKSIKTT
ncbi:MAG: hypothetical protein KAI76_08165, partial [Alphaproteobacteria bacterium]|nr:hypothetical protein [Alphaproteobacteria bacterium]